jgi:hypothetical protein
MFANENVGQLGATDKKEKKKVIKMKDVFVIPDHLKDKYSKKEKHLKPKKEPSINHQPQLVADKFVKDNSKKVVKMDSQVQNNSIKKFKGDGFLRKQ